MTLDNIASLSSISHIGSVACLSSLASLLTVTEGNSKVGVNCRFPVIAGVERCHFRFSDVTPNLVQYIGRRLIDELISDRNRLISEIGANANIDKRSRDRTLSVSIGNHFDAHSVDTSKSSWLIYRYSPSHTLFGTQPLAYLNAFPFRLKELTSHRYLQHLMLVSDWL